MTYPRNIVALATSFSKLLHLFIFLSHKIKCKREPVFDIHKSVHRNIISIVKPTRCTNVSNLFYFGMTLYMFRTVFLSIIRSSRLYIQQQAFVKQSKQTAVSVWHIPTAVCTVLNS